MEKILIFDTTLRDGEQSPGASMNLGEKLAFARQLERLNVDVIEAGFPSSSPGDFESVKKIAQEIRGPQIAGLARTTPGDIDTAWEALKNARAPRIHVFIATSDIHLKYKLRKSREEVLEEAGRAVAHAKRYTPDVEFSAEDATRSDWEYLARVIEARHRSRGHDGQHPRYRGVHDSQRVREIDHLPPGKGEEISRRPSSRYTATMTWGWRWPTA